MSRYLLSAVLLALALFYGGCEGAAPHTVQVEGSTERGSPKDVLEKPSSPFELLDEYFTYLMPREQQELWQAFAKKGFQRTIEDLAPPGSWWYPRLSAGRIDTAHGYLTGEEFVKFSDDGARILRQLRGAAKSPTGG